METLAPVMSAVLRSHGVLHLLFHPGHIAKPGQADAFIEAANRAREAGMEWWTAGAINAWERARRQVTWRAYPQGSGGATWCLRTGRYALPQATLLWLSPPGAKATVNATEHNATSVERWGFRFQSIVFDAEANCEYEVKVT